MITEITTSFPDGGAPELADRRLRPRLPADASARTRAPGRRRATATRRTRSPASTTSTRRSRRPRSSTRRSSRTRRATGSSSRSSPTAITSSSTSTSSSTLHFAPPNDKATAVVRLVWGEGLLSFKPEANLAGQISQVEVYGWDPKTKKPIVGGASRGRGVRARRARARASS